MLEIKTQCLLYPFEFNQRYVIFNHEEIRSYNFVFINADFNIVCEKYFGRVGLWYKIY